MGAFKQVAAKLRDHEPLTPEELQLLREWLAEKEAKEGFTQAHMELEVLKGHRISTWS